MAKRLYVCFLDADDTLLPSAIESGLAAFADHTECAFVYGDSCDVDVNGAVQSAPRGFRVSSHHYRALLEGNFIGMHATVLYRRDILQAMGGFDTNFARCEDYELYLRIARQYAVREHRATVAHYRQHELNMSRDHTAMMDAAVSAVHMQRPYIARDPALRRAARKGVAVWRDYYGELLYEDLRWWVGEKGLTRSACRILRDLMLRCPRKLTAHLLAAAVRRTKRMLACARQRCSAVRRVDFGEFRRLTPFSRQFGFDRGQPLDRYYIEQFLESEAKHIRGAVLEIGDASYTRRFGAERVSSSDVLDLVPGAPGATITADLTGSDLPPDSFDCIILTQTLHFIFDLPGAIKNVFRMLRPAGCLLVTAPGISQICRDQTDRESDSWRFTASSASRLFAEDFGEQNISVASYGNVLAATAFLYGLPVSGMKQSELAFTDPDYPLIISVKAVKARQSL